MGSLAFVSPAFLAALAAIAIPILIHLINRKKAVKWQFAAMEFLLRSHRKVVRRLQMKQFLLLLLRCLIIAAVAFAFARPFLKRARGSSPTKARAIVLIIDDSMSMSYQDGGTTLFARAKRRGLKLLGQLRGEDQVALLRGSTTKGKGGGEQTELTFDKNAVASKLKKWQPSYRSTDLISAMRRAGAMLEKVRGLQPTLVILSDFAQHALDSAKLPKLSSLPAIELIPIRSKKAPINRAIIGLRTEPAPFASNDAYQFTVTVQNFSGEAVKDLPIQIFIGKRPRARGFVTLSAYTTAQKSFIIRLPRAGVYTGMVEIGKDKLTQDDRFYFALQARQRPKVLLVNGDPRTIPYLDELYYLDRALQDPSTPFVLQTIHASAQLPDPNKYQAVFLVNVPKIPLSWVGNLRRFVSQGGGLFLVMGSQVDVQSYNQRFEGLLPRPLRSVALAAQRPDGTGIALQRYFGEVTAFHPIFRRLYQDGLVFQSARVSRLMLVETRKGKGEGKVLWRFSHGPPALLERKVGRGRVLLLTTTLDRDWTDLCIRPFFQPWIKQVTTYLAGGARFQQSRILTVDQTARVAVTGPGAVTLKMPKGKTRILRPNEGMITFPGGPMPGIYRFSRDGKPIKLLPKIVNVDPRESNLKPMARQELVPIGSLTTQLSTLSFQQSERLWPFLFLCLVLFFIMESAILRFL